MILKKSALLFCKAFYKKRRYFSNLLKFMLYGDCMLIKFVFFAPYQSTSCSNAAICLRQILRFLRVL